MNGGGKGGGGIRRGGWDGKKLDGFESGKGMVRGEMVKWMGSMGGTRGLFLDHDAVE